MNLALRKSEQFIADFHLQYRWYFREAGNDVARRFLLAVDGTLEKLAKFPDIGYLRHFPQPELRRVRSFSVERPFHRHLIFYRANETDVEVWRMMHGARDLPKRLLEPTV